MQYFTVKGYFESIQNQGNSTIDNDALMNIGEGFWVTFWALFGQIDIDYFLINDTRFQSLSIVGMIIFGVFNVAAVLVALNMLIAILNESYTRTSIQLIWTFWLSARCEILGTPKKNIFIIEENQRQPITDIWVLGSNSEPHWWIGNILTTVSTLV
ncbi:short transient receptor potential channel 7-like [Acropora millepora]|uniref:short transient receptor potential channel 7-like n=1 Tax=Acropora millepora TaxID=45264 RepID=UPI001CF5E0C5|nr:short transient receptor potential channel 7-like [Acropora millepora]